MSFVWDENEPVSRPGWISEEEWLAATPGRRVRMLHNAEQLIELPEEERKRVARLPLWMCCGPEDGLPEDFFNARGFLLPIFRPGGPRHDEFRRWRRWFRVWQRSARRLQERMTGLYERVEPWRIYIYIAGALGVLGIWTQVSTSVKEPGREWRMLVVLGVASVLIHFLYELLWMVLGSIAKRIGIWRLNRHLDRRAAMQRADGRRRPVEWWSG